MLLKCDKTNLQNTYGMRGLLAAGLLNFLPVITTEETKSFIIIEIICRETCYFNNYESFSLFSGSN